MPQTVSIATPDVLRGRGRRYLALAKRVTDPMLAEAYRWAAHWAAHLMFSLADIEEREAGLPTR